MKNLVHECDFGVSGQKCIICERSKPPIIKPDFDYTGVIKFCDCFGGSSVINGKKVICNKCDGKGHLK
jgi:hypothetical protein